MSDCGQPCICCMTLPGFERQLAHLTKERDVARAALEKSDEVVLHMQWCRECAEELPCAQVRDDVAAIAARAGVTP